jgi:two-component system, NarL family, capsular synthesis sensor histidine kinase RcsC
MDQSLSTQTSIGGQAGGASRGQELSALRRYQRRLLYGGGGLLTLIILLAVIAGAISDINSFHARQRQVFHDGQAAIDAFLSQRDRAYANSINAIDTLWATRQSQLSQAGASAASEFLAQGEQVSILAPNKIAVPWLALGRGANAMPSETLAAYMGMLQEYSTYTAASVSAVQSSGQFNTYAYDPSGTLLAVAGIRDEAQLFQILNVSSREQAFAALMQPDARVKTVAASGEGMLSASHGRFVSYYGENLFTGKPSLIGITTLMVDGKVYFRQVVMEAMDNLKTRLTSVTSDTFAIFTPDGQAVLKAGEVPIMSPAKLSGLLQNRQLLVATSSVPALWREGGTYIVAGPLFGVDWTMVHFYSWRDVLAADGRQWAITGAVVLLILVLLWSLLLRMDRHVFAPALADASLVYESEALNRTIIETSPVGLCLLDPVSGRPILQNDVVCSVTGTDDKSELDTLFHQLIAHANEQEAATATHEFQWALDTSEGKHRHLQVAMASSSYRNQPVWVCALRDVTAQIDLEENLRSARQDSERARIAAESASQAKTAFVATMSHEIRTPLNGVLGHLELLSRSPLNPAQRERLDRIRLSADALLEIISDVLDFSRIEAGQLDIDPMPFQLRPLVEQAALLFAPAAQRKGVKLYFAIDPALASDYVSDVHRLRQILNNLLGNAVKFTESGRIILRVSAGDSTVEAPTWLRFQVVDSGIGMNEQQVAQLFQPFTQADASISRRFGGSGLGLALCQQLSHLLDGRLSAESTQGVGSVFTLDVPAEPVGVVEKSTSPLSGSRVALLSAAAEWRAEIGALLTAWGATVTVAGLPGDLKNGVADVLVVFGEPRSWTQEEEQDLLLSYARVIRAYANGPLIPEQRDGSVFISCYASEALLSAIQMESDRAGAVPHQPSIQSTMLAGRGRVLLVEDNPVNRELIQQQLEELGFEVDVAEDGEDGLRKWKPSTYVAVLTDINMPRMSGYELARALRGHDDRLPIMAITATALASEKAQCRDAGINEVLLKPLSLESLNEALAHHLAQDDASESLPADRKAFSAKILRTFVERGVSDLAVLRRASEEHDTQTLIDVIHSFKGALLMLGESAAAGECSLMELRLREQAVGISHAELWHLIGTLQSVVDKYKADLAG